jgi:hypothetical protein
MHGAKLFRDLLARLHVGIRPPVTCIPDGVMSLTLQVAEEMSIPALVFRTTSACGFMGYLHFAELIDRGYVPLKGTISLVSS